MAAERILARIFRPAERQHDRRGSARASALQLGHQDGAPGRSGASKTNPAGETADVRYVEGDVARAVRTLRERRGDVAPTERVPDARGSRRRRGPSRADGRTARAGRPPQLARDGRRRATARPGPLGDPATRAGTTWCARRAPPTTAPSTRPPRAAGSRGGRREHGQQAVVDAEHGRLTAFGGHNVAAESHQRAYPRVPAARRRRSPPP